jgi:hypothetical protein
MLGKKKDSREIIILKKILKGTLVYSKTHGYPNIKDF